MKKLKKDVSFKIRMDDLELSKLEEFVSHWEKVGIKLTKSEIIRNAINEYFGIYDFDEVLLNGDFMGVRFDANQYEFEDLFNMTADAQKDFENETDPSKKYLKGKLFKLLSDNVSLAFNIARNNKLFKVKTPQEVMILNYRTTKRLSTNLGDFKK